MRRHPLILVSLGLAAVLAAGALGTGCSRGGKDSGSGESLMGTVPGYYKASGLTKLPRIASSDPLVYPDAVRRKGVQGRVLIRMLVSASGSIDSVQVMDEVQGYPSLTQAALEAAHSWKLEPGELNGKPVPTELIVPFDFKINGPIPPDSLDTDP